jgi:hypothetical protein
MPENDSSKSNLGESYQPNATKTYTPKVITQQTQDSYSPVLTTGGSYQPVIPITVSSEQPTPPTGGSGVPAARSNGSEGGSNPSAQSPSE